MTVSVAVSYRCWWRPPLFLPSLWLFQSQRPADSDGGPSWRICPRCALSLFHPRGRIQVPKGTCRIFKPAGYRRRPLQLVLSLERYRRIHQTPISLPLVRYVTRWLPQQILPKHHWLVARTGHLHKRIVAGCREVLETCTGMVKKEHTRNFGTYNGMEFRAEATKVILFLYNLY